MASSGSLEAAVRSAFKVEGILLPLSLSAGREGQAELELHLDRQLRIGAGRWPASFLRPRHLLMDARGRLFLADAPESRLAPDRGGHARPGLVAGDRDLVLSYLYGSLAPSFAEVPVPWLEAMACLYGLVVLEGLDAYFLARSRGPACIDTALSARLALIA